MFESYSIKEIVRQVQTGEKTIEELSQHLPCYLHINSLEDFSILESDTQLLKNFDLSLKEINEQGYDLIEKTVDKHDLKNAIEINLNYLSNQEKMTHIAFLQHATFPNTKREELFYTRGKIIDPKRILNLSLPIHDLQLFNHDAIKLYHNSSFIKNNIHKFNKLTKRELEICAFLCKGESLNKIALELNVSIHTIKNHKINIYKKMEVNNYFDFYNFCSKFKLIN